MSSCWGENIKISIFGQSHSGGIGVVIDGLPAGFRPDLEELQGFMARRAPGKNKLSTKRKEGDVFEILSGLSEGYTCGAPLCAVIRNSDTRSGDYANLKDIPRPGHADFTANVKYGGFQDTAGGGHFSGRLTAPLCFAGGLALQWLRKEGVLVGSHILKIHGICDDSFHPVMVNAGDFSQVLADDFPVLNKKAGEKMKEEILRASADGDSVGGVIECAAIGLPVGLGDPIFSGMENRIASIVFGIPAVKGLEFGAGFGASELFGSENNDSFRVKNGDITCETNNQGGILGGITSGLPLVFRAAFKPTPSIFKTQQSVSMKEMENRDLVIHGRHDPCIVQRAVPCVEAACALAIFDAFLERKKQI